MPAAQRKDFSINRRFTRTAAVLALASTVVSYSPAYALEPPKAVRIRLLSNESLSSVTLEAYAGLRVSQQRAWGKVTISVIGNAIHVVDEKDLNFVSTYANFASRAGRWIDMQRPYKTNSRTVGWIQITVKDGKLQMVNVLPIETYVLGIVEGELGSLNFHPESLKAQLVASRSYVLAKLGRHKVDGFDFCDRPHCQYFKGTDSIRPDYKQAMSVTRGEYMAFKGRPIPAFYHDNCGGKTAAIQDVWKTPSCPYLPSVEDNATETDDEMDYCRNAPTATWSFDAQRDVLRKCFSREGWIRGYDALDTLRVIRINSSDRAHQVLVQTAHPRWISASEFRRVLNAYFGKEVVKSTYFMITRKKDTFTLSGKGWGHGVGLCQWGAIEMGRQGHSYREILRHYYPGTNIQRLIEPSLAQKTNSPTID